MIARIWRGMTGKDRADDYLAYLRETGLRDYGKIAGHLCAFVVRRDQGEHCEIQIISIWQSMEAVHQFAGANAEQSVYYPDDRQYLLDMEPLVRHYDVADFDVSGLLAGQPPA